MIFLGIAAPSIESPAINPPLKTENIKADVENLETKPVESQITKNEAEIVSPVMTNAASSVASPPPQTTGAVVAQPSASTSPEISKANSNGGPSSNVLQPNLSKMALEIKQKKEMFHHLDQELSYLRHVNTDLAEKTRVSQERMIMRQKDQQQLLDNYSEHIRSRRATNDDALTIQRSLQDLKASIKTLSVALAHDCDPKTATEAISGFWINLKEAIPKLGDPLPKPRIQMLTEKFLMDVLVQNMSYNMFTGLKISQPYSQLQMWFQHYDPAFCTRLRQEMAKIVVTGNVPGSDIQQEIQKFNKRMYNSLYTSLLKAYPSIEMHDQEEKDTKKHYTAALKNLVDHASQIGYAIRGQEVEIAAGAVVEGTGLLEPSIMVDEDGQEAGLIQFCVCPPFIMYGARTEVLEKARVLCSPLPENATK